MSKKLARVEAALRAQAAGVVLRLRDWNGFTKKEQGAWLMARQLLARGLPREEAKPSSAIAESPERDPELRAVLERGAELVERARGGG